MKTKKTIISLALAASVAVIVSGCSGGGNSDSSSNSSSSVDFSKKPSGSMTAEGFTLGDEVATSRADLATAKLKKDGVSVKISEGNFDAQKFAAQAASGKLPDLVAMKSQYVATYAAKGLIMPLNKCFEAHNTDPNKRWYKALVDQVSYKGKIYGIPQFFQTYAVLLNQRVAKQAGVTADQFNMSNPDQVLAATKKMFKEENGDIKTLGFDPQMGTNLPGGQIGIWPLVFGGKLMDDQGRPTLDDPNNIKAWKWLKKIYDAQGGYAKVTSFITAWDLFGAKNPYVKDQVGAGLFAQWYPNVLTPYSSKVELAGEPLYDSSGKVIATDGGQGQAYTIPVKGDNPSAACSWALADTSDAAWVAATKARLKKVADTPGGLFTGLFTGSATADKLILDKYQKPTGNEGFDSAINAYVKELESGNTVSYGSSPAGLQIQSELLNAMVPAMTGKKSVKEALKDAQAAAMAAYKQAIK